MAERRYAPLTGALSVALLVGAFVIDPVTEFMPSEQDAVAHFAARPLRIVVASYLGMLAAASLLWFSGSVYGALRRRDDDGGRLAALAFGGGAFAAVLIAVGNVATMAAAERVRVTGVIDPGAAAGLFDVSGIAMGNGAPVGLAILIGASALVGLRTPGSSRPFGVAGLVMALALLSPFGWVALAGGLVWVAAMSITMLRTDPTRILTT